MKISKNFYSHMLGIILTLYITSTIIFRQHFISVTYLLGATMIALFFFFVYGEDRRKFKINTFIKFYAALTGVALASSFWAVDFDLAAIKSIQMIYILINMYVLYNVIKIYHLEKYFLYGILLGALGNYILLLGPFPAPFEIYVGWRPVGSMGNANVLALMMNMSIFASIIYLYLYKAKRFFLLYLYINVFLAIYIIFLTASKKGLLLGILLTSIFIILNMKSIKTMVGTTVIIILAVIFFQSNIDLSEFFHQFDLVLNRFNAFIDQIQGQSEFGSTAERLHFINLGINLFAERSILGYGIDNFRIYGGTYSHNNYIEILVGTGLIGFSFLMLMYFSILYKIIKIKHQYMRFALFSLMIGLMVTDMAMVSYSNKVIIFFILFLSIIAEEISKSIKLKELKQ